MSDYPMLISNKLHSFRNFVVQSYILFCRKHHIVPSKTLVYLFLGIALGQWRLAFVERILAVVCSVNVITVRTK